MIVFYLRPRNQPVLTIRLPRYRLVIRLGLDLRDVLRLLALSTLNYVVEYPLAHLEGLETAARQAHAVHVDVLDFAVLVDEAVTYLGAVPQYRSLAYLPDPTFLTSEFLVPHI